MQFSGKTMLLTWETMERNPVPGEFMQRWTHKVQDYLGILSGTLCCLADSRCCTWWHLSDVCNPAQARKVVASSLLQVLNLGAFSALLLVLLRCCLSSASMHTMAL